MPGCARIAKGFRGDDVRCVYLDSGGRQCPAVAIAGGEFCAAHQRVRESEMTESNSPRPLLYRLAALFLLLMFLMNAYQMIQEWLGS